MDVFTKVCAVLAFAVGLLFIVLGILGVFFGCRANFTLPPVLGGLPIFVGWGIVGPIVVAWRGPRRPAADQARFNSPD